MKGIIQLVAVLTLFGAIILEAQGVEARSDTQAIDISGSANDLVVNYDYPENAVAGQSFDVSMNAFSSTTGLTVTINGGSAWTYNGCSFVSETTAGTLTGIKSARVRVSMDTATCSATATVQVTLTVGGALESQAYITMNVFQPSTTTAITSWPTLGVVNFNCGASGTTVAGLGSSTCLNPQTDNVVRLCAASTWGASCTTPTVAITGTLTVTNAGGQTMTVSGTLDVLDRICAAAATGSTCTVATVNTPLSGTVSVAQSGTWTVTNAGSQAITLSGTTHQIIDSWPALTAAVTNSGTIAVTNSGGQTVTLAGTATLAGGITVTNAGGQAITVTSWPQLNAVLSGTVLGCSSAALAADPKACTLNTNTNTTIVGDVNQTLNFPSKLTIGFPGDANHQSVDWFLELVFWAAIIYVCFRFNWWFVFGFAIVGAIHLVVPSWTALTPATFLMFLLLGIIIEFVRFKDKQAKANANGMA